MRHVRSVQLEAESAPIQSVGRLLKLAQEAVDLDILLRELKEMDIAARVFIFEGHEQGVQPFGVSRWGGMGTALGAKTYYRSTLFPGLLPIDLSLKIGEEAKVKRYTEVMYSQSGFPGTSRLHLVIWNKSFRLSEDGFLSRHEFVMVPLPTPDGCFT